jgi:hypothetical protein
MTPMRLKCIACDVLARPVYLSAAHSPHIVDVTLARFGLHLTPQKLRQVLQTHIDQADQENVYDAVVLAYGLCGKATHNLQAGRLPLVIPRAHDCITLFLGGRERYNREFSACPGTYWYVKDYIERGDSEDVPLSIGAHTSADAEELYAEYVEKYGMDNADFLMETMNAWQSHYERAAFIDMNLGADEDVADRAQSDAQRRGWRFSRLAGDLVLIKRLLEGRWDEDFLILEPGQRVEMIGGDEVIQAHTE